MKLPIKFTKSEKGFTLIELLVVISIIAVLIAAAAVSYTRAQAKSRDGKRKADLIAVQQALEQYYQRNGIYPGSFLSIFIQCNVAGDNSYHQWGQAFTCNSVTYMNSLPKDPTYSGSSYYKYTSASPFQTYQLNSILENTNDQDYCPPSGSGCTKLPCQPASGFNYCVVNP